MGSSFFSRGTAVEPDGPGRYRAQLADAWNCPFIPHGGVATALAARAMATELGDPTQSLRSVHTVFAGQVRDGDVEVDVTTLRRGRSMSQFAATIRNPGEDAGLTAVAVFGAVRDGFEFVDATPPADIPAPVDCPSFRDGPSPEAPPEFLERNFYMNFWDQIEGRIALAHAPWDDYEPTSSMRALWYRFDDPPRTDDGAWDPLALVAVCDTMPGAVNEILGSRAHGRPWLPPSTDLTVHVLDEARCEWILAVNRARHASDGYASVDIELWDVESAAPRLVAYATQVMFFTFPAV